MAADKWTIEERDDKGGHPFFVKLNGELITRCEDKDQAEDYVARMKGSTPSGD